MSPTETLNFPVVSSLVVSAARNLAEVAQQGYSGLTFEGVTRRAGTSKPVLYRRYTNRADMMIAAIMQSVSPDVGTLPIDQGLRSGLVAAMEVLIGRLSRFGVATLIGVMSEAEADSRKRIVEISIHPGLTYLKRLYQAEITAGRLQPAVLDELYVKFPLIYILGEIVVRAEVNKATLPRQIDDVIIPALRSVH